MSEELKNLVKNLLFIIIVGVATHYSAFYFGIAYDSFFPESVGGGGLFSIPHDAGLYLIGLPLSYIFILTFLFITFGGKGKYWWMGILLIPAAVFELYFDASHIYFPIALGAIGWLLGWLAARLLSKLRGGLPPRSLDLS